MAIKINGSTVISDSQAITSTSTISATGNVTAGNLVTGGTLSVTGNITGGNIIGTIASGSSNVSAGNLNVAGVGSVGSLRIAGYGNVINASGVWVGSNSGLQGTTGSTGAQGTAGSNGAQGTAGSNGAQGTTGSTGAQGATGPSTAINATAVSTGTFYPVFVAAAGSNQTPSIRTAATAFSFDAATNTLTVTSTSAQYADIAECYRSDEEYEPGTVVEFGGDAEVTMATTDMSKRVAGVITTDPAYLMNSQLSDGIVAAVALTGRVPCKVVGKVSKGDIMVSAGNGQARAEADPKVGTVIGKALENFDGDQGVIEVVVGRF